MAKEVSFGHTGGLFSVLTFPNPGVPGGGSEQILFDTPLVSKGGSVDGFVYPGAGTVSYTSFGAMIRWVGGTDVVHWSSVLGCCDHFRGSGVVLA